MIKLATAIEEASWPYRFLRWIARVLVRLLTRTQVIGLENLPPSGAVLLVGNHLHMFDPPLALAILPRRGTVFAADDWVNKPVIGHLIRWTGASIPVTRGEVDRRALSQALEVLKQGGVLGIAPEGTRSKTGALQQAHSGVAFLATRSGAPIQLLAISGTEKAIAAWKRLRRPAIRVVFSEPFVLPGAPNKAKGEQLDAYTEDIMRRLAALLPPEYRGVYG